MSRINELLEGILLEDFLDKEGLEYKLGRGSRGEQLNIETCPFCGGSEFKVYANRDTGLGNCFHGSCQTTFNKFTFIREELKNAGDTAVMPYLDQLAREIGWRPNKKRVEIETEGPTDWHLPTSIALPTPAGQNLKYLMDRKIGNDAAEMFGLRWCHDGWFPYKKNDDSDGWMNFSNRVLIPVYDIDGTMVTFQGRDITGAADRKYMFPPGLPGTASYLYNSHRALGSSKIIMNEGAFDVIRTALNIEGTEFADYGVVGSFGISLSSGRSGEDQVSQLLAMKARGLKEVIVMWDGEQGAFKKAVAAAKQINKIGIQGKVACLPAGRDPGEATSAECLKALRNSVQITPASAIKLSLSTPYSGSQR